MPFERLGADQTAIEGTGIGLPLARAFAEAMEGHLTAASIPGEGTTFTADPAAGSRTWSRPRMTHMARSRSRGTGTEDPAGTDLGVLYIEDNPANIEVVSRFLRTRPGVRLQSVTSGQAGLALAAQEIPDLILLDLHLPGLHGHEVLETAQGRASHGRHSRSLSCPPRPRRPSSATCAPAASSPTSPSHSTSTELGQLIDSFAAELEHEAGPAPRTARGTMKGVVLYIDDQPDLILRPLSRLTGPR